MAATWVIPASLKSPVVITGLLPKSRRGSMQSGMSNICTGTTVSDLRDLHEQQQSSGIARYPDLGASISRVWDSCTRYNHTRRERATVTQLVCEVCPTDRLLISRMRVSALDGSLPIMAMSNALWAAYVGRHVSHLYAGSISYRRSRGEEATEDV